MIDPALDSRVNDERIIYSFIDNENAYFYVPPELNDTFTRKRRTRRRGPRSETAILRRESHNAIFDAKCNFTFFSRITDVQNTSPQIGGDTCSEIGAPRSVQIPPQTSSECDIKNALLHSPRQITSHQFLPSNSAGAVRAPDFNEPCNFSYVNGRNFSDFPPGGGGCNSPPNPPVINLSANFTIIHLNVRGYLSNFLKFQAELQSCHVVPEIICLTKTHSDSSM